MAKVTPINKKSQQEKIAECHSFGHEWRKLAILGIDDSDPTIKRPFGAETGMIGLPYVCVVCTSRKVRWVTRSGESINRYEYCEGYAFRTALGDTVLTPSEWRRDYVATIFKSFESNIRKANRA
jgi:hypothetical protein